MREVKISALVLEGAETNVPLDATREWVKSLPDTRLLLIPTARHQAGRSARRHSPPQTSLQPQIVHSYLIRRATRKSKECQSCLSVNLSGHLLKPCTLFRENKRSVQCLCFLAFWRTHRSCLRLKRSMTRRAPRPLTPLSPTRSRNIYHGGPSVELFSTN